MSGIGRSEPEPDFDIDITIDPEALARAEAALSRLADTYLAWAEADVVSMRACMDEITANPIELSDPLWRLFRIAHDMKGQAATFGYPLVTDIAHHMCRLLESVPQPGADDMKRLGRHVDALSTIITLRLEGDGGEDGRTILANLD